VVLITPSVVAALAIGFEFRIVAMAPGLDAAFVYAFNHEAARHAQWGREFLSTYGPIGYLISTIDVGGLVWSRLVASFVLAVGFAIAAAGFMAGFRLLLGSSLLHFVFWPRFCEVSSTVRHRTVAALVAGLLGCIAPLASSEAALASAPFAVSLAVSPRASGNGVTVRIELHSTHALEAIDPFDLYVMQLQGFQNAQFMTASGSWSPSPASLRQGLSARGFAPVTVQWTEGRLGTIHLLVIAARASSDPFVQANWLFRPVLRGAPVRRSLADAPDRRQATLVLAGLGGLSLTAIGVVLYLTRRRRGPIS
jgi:hypothetical protein